MLFERVLSACIKSVSLSVAALVLAFGCGQAVTASAGEMTVSAAASLTNAFAELKTAFEKSHQGLTVHTNFAASNPLLKQMQEGAPVDVFASADQETMDKAQKAQLIKPESRKNFVSNTRARSSAALPSSRRPSASPWVRPKACRWAVIRVTP